jgi:recombination endonuclease VII
MKRGCKDCGSTTRKVTTPGPRCASCHRERRKHAKRLAHGRWIKKTYGLTLEQYEALYEAQGGECYICMRATGKTKRLAVDHDHKTGYVRGLLCSTCNNILGHLRDDVIAAYRLSMYLRYPPAFDTIGKVKPDD